MDGVWTRLKLAFAAFFTILFKGRLPAALEAVGAGRASEPAPLVAAAVSRDDPVDRAVQLMALLQRDGRLVDFLMEDLATYTDAQIGAAVRDVHAGCRRALDRYLTLDAIVTEPEGGPTTVNRPVDAAAIRLVGAVTGEPPFHGTLLHRGWRVTRIELPPLGQPETRRIVAQAEVEVA